MNKKEKEQEARIQELEAECLQEILAAMYKVLLHAGGFTKFWEEVRRIREKYLEELKEIE